MTPRPIQKIQVITGAMALSTSPTTLSQAGGWGGLITTKENCSVWSCSNA